LLEQRVHPGSFPVHPAAKTRLAQSEPKNANVAVAVASALRAFGTAIEKLTHDSVVREAIVKAGNQHDRTHLNNSSPLMRLQDRQYRLGHVQSMKDYAQTRDCRRRYILNYFGEPYPNPCGACDNCEAGTVEKVEAETSDLPFALKSRVSHKKLGEGVVMRYEEDGGKVLVQFDSEGEKSMVVDVVLENELMEAIAPRG
jgi:hypothetical protein